LYLWIALLPPNQQNTLCPSDARKALIFKHIFNFLNILLNLPVFAAIFWRLSGTEGGVNFFWNIKKVEPHMMAAQLD
jgi:hypothetical protein